MELILNRQWPDRQNGKERYSVGRLLINGRYQCNTLELPTKDENGQDNSGKKGYAIQKGEYDIKCRYSPKFSRSVLWITREGDKAFNERYILFHAGNKVCDTQGCVLVGENVKVGWLANSRKWENAIFEQVYPVLKAGGRVKLRVI